jgi:hypothetical protein
MWEIHQELLRGASFSPLRRVTPRANRGIPSENRRRRRWKT